MIITHIESMVFIIISVPITSIVFMLALILVIGLIYSNIGIKVMMLLQRVSLINFVNVIPAGKNEQLKNHW